MNRLAQVMAGCGEKARLRHIRLLGDLPLALHCFEQVDVLEA